MVVRQGVAVRRAARGRPASARSTSSSPPTKAAGGRPVDRDALHWWLVAKTLWWGIGCMGQAWAHLSGAVRSHELAAIGRRVAEQEWDLIELLAPEEWKAAGAAPLPRPAPRRRRALRTPDRTRDARRRAAVPHRGRHARHDRPPVVPCPRRREHARRSSSASSRNRPVAYDGDDWASLAMRGAPSSSPSRTRSTCEA